MCNNHEKDQVHVLHECPALEQLNIRKEKMEYIYSVKTYKY